MIDVDANLFRAAAVCQSTEEVRSYLNGVFIRRHPKGGVLLVSTDGHRLFVGYDEKGKAPARVRKIICIPHVGLNACAPRKKEPASRLVIDEGGMAQVAGLWCSDKSCFVNGTFPDWK